MTKRLYLRLILLHTSLRLLETGFDLKKILNCQAKQ